MYPSNDFSGIGGCAFVTNRLDCCNGSLLLCSTASGIERAEFPDPPLYRSRGATFVLDLNILDCFGFDSPLDSGPVTVKKHRVLPLRAKLVDADGFPVTPFEIVSPPVIQVIFSASANPQVIDVTDQALATGHKTEGNQFVFEADQWRFNLSTKHYSAPGTYIITMESGDEAEYAVRSCEAVFVVEP
jgi:hypothetical protein